MKKFSFKLGEKGTAYKEHKEQLTLGKMSAKGSFVSFSGLSGEHWVCIIPSLNTSGYGATEEEAYEDLKQNVDIFFEDIFSVSELKRQLFLKDLGWNPSQFFKRQFSKSYVDENGTLQNFDFPEQVKKKVLSAA